eukprot:774736_1
MAELETNIEPRLAWKVGSNVFIYCDAKKRFVLGVIDAINMDGGKEWLTVRYDIDGGRPQMKVVERYGEHIQPYANDITTFIEANKKDIFEEKQSHEDTRVERLYFVSQVYTKWMTMGDKKMDTGTDMRDIIQNDLHPTYSLSSFLSDYRVVSQLNKDLLLGDDDLDEKAVCTASQCMILDRNARDREYLKNNNEKRRALYFMRAQANEDMMNKSVSIQQILDTLHELIYHTVYVKVGDIDAMFKAKQAAHDASDMDHVCDDVGVQDICDLIAKKQKDSNRYRDKRRDGDDGASYNKFQTTNQVKSASITKVMEKKKEKTKCLMDILFRTLKEKGIKEDELCKVAAFITAERYESDSIVFDLKSANGLNLKHAANISNLFQEIARTFIKENEIKKKLYSGGKRYFYWPFYKDNEQERHLVFEDSLGQPRCEENPGYKLCDWYIEAKYDNLKDELLHNLICVFGKEQYENTLAKAMDKLSGWVNDEGVANISCKWPYWKATYGIEKGDEITLEHILSVMFYTNYSKQCYEFSATFRRVTQYESDEDMKSRHREYAIWGRLLREAVECFGTAMQDSDIKTFYHGVSDTLYFDTTSIQLCGPMSTTSDFTVAVNTFSDDGLVISIPNDDTFTLYFDCVYWSDYPQEREKLFIGGLQPFPFKTIRNMSVRPVQNYHAYVQVIDMFHRMIEGFAWNDGEINTSNLEVLELLIEEEMQQKAVNEMASKVPQYVLNLWHHFLSKIKRIEFDWILLIKSGASDDDNDQFGYGVFSPLFLSSDLSSLKFDAFIGILPNLEMIHLFMYDPTAFAPSIPLGDSFKSEVLQAISSLDKLSRFGEIIIVNPTTDISEFITQNKNEFNQYGWKLTK